MTTGINARLTSPNPRCTTCARDFHGRLKRSPEAEKRLPEKPSVPLNREDKRFLPWLRG